MTEASKVVQKTISGSSATQDMIWCKLASCFSLSETQFSYQSSAYFPLD